MTPPQKAQLDRDLAPPALKEETIDRQNAEQMRLLGGMGIGPRRPAARPRVRKRADE